MSNYKRTQVQLTTEQHEKVRKLAFERDISMALWIREAVDEKLEREAEKESDS